MGMGINCLCIEGFFVCVGWTCGRERTVIMVNQSWPDVRCAIWLYRWINACVFGMAFSVSFRLRFAIVNVIRSRV